MAGLQALRLALSLAVAVVGSAPSAAGAAEPGLGSPWTGAGTGTVTVVSDGSATDPELRYLARRTFSGSWSFQTTAASDTALTILYAYAPAHADLLVSVRMASFVTHDGVTRTTPLVSDAALLCCSPRSGSGLFQGTAVFELATGDAYGFRMRGSNLDIGQLEGTLGLQVASPPPAPEDLDPAAPPDGGPPPVAPAPADAESGSPTSTDPEPPERPAVQQNDASSVQPPPLQPPPAAAPRAARPQVARAVERPGRRTTRSHPPVRPVRTQRDPATPTAPPAAERPDPDALVNDNPQRSDVVALLRRPDNLPLGADDIGRSLGITGLLLALLGLPARLLSKTLQKNRDEIAGWFAPVRATFARITPRAAQHLLGIAATSALIGAATLSFLDPTFPNKRFPGSFALGMLLASSVVVMTQALTWRRYLRRRAPELTGGWAVYPGQVALSAICVAVSRIAHFAPGLMFGMHGDFEPRGRLSLERAGRRIALTFGTLLLIGLAAWIASIPVAHAAARQDASFVTLAFDAGLAGIASLGMQSIAFGLVPLVFLDGHVMCRWRPGWWLALWSLGLGWLALVVINPALWHQPAYPISVGWLAGLLAFQALVAAAVWSFFAFRRGAVSPRPAGA